MHAFHDYMRHQLHEQLKQRSVVVFYDPGQDFLPFLEELPVVHGDGPLPQVSVGDITAYLAKFEGSYFGLRARIEPFVAVDGPEPIIVYVPENKPEKKYSVLMELEEAGTSYTPSLKRLARNVLKEKLSDGVIDKLLAPEKVSYQDIVEYLSQTDDRDQGVSVLKLIFPPAADNAQVVAEWLVDEGKDKPVGEKRATAELFALVGRMGLELDQSAPLKEARLKTLRFALANEFRSDLSCEAPSQISMIPEPRNSDQLRRVKQLTSLLRKHHPDAYASLADRVEVELGLAHASLETDSLGSVDTFRFAEKFLLRRCGELIADRRYKDASAIIAGRGASFWARRDVQRQAQWESCRLMAELGQRIEEVRSTLGKPNGNPSTWVRKYVDDEGWFRVDQAHRHMEAFLTSMEEDPESEKPIGVLRREYEYLLLQMTEGFSKALRAATWVVPGVLPQSRIYPDVVLSTREPTAYFLVDSLRYEMGAEMVGIMREAEDMLLRPAVAALPTITQVGMAALMPGAAASFSVVAQSGAVAAKIENSTMSDAPDRVKFMKAKVPDVADYTLAKLFSSSPSKVAKDISGASLIVVRTQAIDRLGETADDHTARQAMDTMLGNVARGVRKLAKAGIRHFVIASDHGHLFSIAKDDDMKFDNPGGDTVALHRRCWVGRGGATPAGTVRVSGSELGYDADLDFVFPTGSGVFKAGGGLSYHHGGVSLQEMVLPVLAFRMPVQKEVKGSRKTVGMKYTVPITNRAFGLRVVLSADLWTKDPVAVRIALIADGEQVGEARMTAGPEYDATAKCVNLTPGKDVDVGMLLTKDECKSARIVVQDAATDVVLGQTDEIPIRLGI